MGTDMKQGGFTIVELLIVIVVIGILAAITVVAFTGVQGRAHDTTILADMRGLKTKLEAFRIDNNSLYPAGGSSATGLASLEFRASKGAYAVSTTTTSNLWYCRATDQTRFGVVALSKSGKIFTVTSAAEPREYTGATAWSTTASNCGIIESGLTGEYAAYTSTDTTTGPWRAWAGGN